MFRRPSPLAWSLPGSCVRRGFRAFVVHPIWPFDVDVASESIGRTSALDHSLDYASSLLVAWWRRTYRLSVGFPS